MHTLSEAHVKGLLRGTEIYVRTAEIVGDEQDVQEFAFDLLVCERDLKLHRVVDAESPFRYQQGDRFCDYYVCSGEFDDTEHPFTAVMEERGLVCLDVPAHIITELGKRLHDDPFWFEMVDLAAREEH